MRKGQKMSDEAKINLSNKAKERLKNPKELERLQNLRRGTSASEETRRKMSISRSGNKNHNYGKCLSKETKKKISEALKNRPKEKHPNFGKHLSEETRAKISASLSGENNPNFGKTGPQTSMYGKCHTPEAKEKTSKAHKGYIASEETRRKLSSILSGEKHPMYGRYHTEEARAKISEKTKGKNNPMFGKTGELCPAFGKTRELNPMYGKHHTIETRLKLSESHKGKNLGKDNPMFGRRGEKNPNFGKHRSPETRKKLSKALSGEKSPCYGRTGERNYNWRGGISFEPYCPKWTEEFRNRIRTFFGFRCVLCGKTSEENKKQLSCHHVEYNKNACCDGKLVTFAALCGSCHSKTSGRNRQRWEDMFHVIIDYLYDGRSYYTKEEFENLRERSGENDVSTETNSAWKSEMEVESQNVGVGINSSRAETRRSEVSASV